MNKLKLNYKRTLLVGFAFFLILTFWQAYDSIIPKILTDKFGISQFWSGVIMAADNVMAVVLLPLFGALSDKANTKLGRRTPFILIGTIAAAIVFVGLSYVDNMQLTAIADISAVTEEASEARDEAITALFESNVTVEDGKTLADLYGGDAEFIAAINDENDAAREHLTLARQAYARQKTAENPMNLIVFIVLLFFVLLSMAVFRSPAVALMPDITPKPLRSKANAIINLMGTAGGILVLVLGIIFGTGKTENILMNYTTFFTVIAGVMLAALVIFMFTVREVKWSRESDEINRALDGDVAEEKDTEVSERELSTGEKTSLLFILASVVLWYIGYNAVTSKYSVYAGDVLGLDFNLTLIVAQAAAIVSYIPVGIISQKFGRRKTILAGVAMLFTAFFAASFIRAGSSIVLVNCLFALAGIGWATINVNSYPMVVEMAKSSNVGKYTGIYYTASMAAQIFAPIISGFFLTYVGMTTLFPFGAIFVFGSFVTMFVVKHGDAKLESKIDILEHLDAGD